MDNLFKIKEVSNKYDITARSMRYYEDMGLINSLWSDDYAYRMYDETAVRRLEQILILRKLNISIKDIQRVFSASGSDVALEVLGKKVQNIDDEVALLHELKEIVIDFIREIERLNYTENSSIKLLYDKAKEIEAIKDDIEESDTAPYEITEFEGGLYALAVSIDGDDESIQNVEEKIYKWIKHTNFEYDISRDVMGYMTYCDEEIKKGLGYEQIQRYVPIKLREESKAE